MTHSHFDIDKIILTKAGELFAREGIKAISMDMIAAECKISKKTIYKNFETKEFLIHKIVLTTFFENTLGFEKLNYTENIFESIEFIFNAIEKIYSVLTPKFILETKSNFRNIYDLITHFEMITLKSNIQKIIYKGRSQNIFNDVPDENFSIEIFFNFLHNLMNESGSSLCIHDQIKCINNYFLYSLLSPKGLQIQIKSFKNDIDNK
ncbi:TetR/AcrR family transcriptional regulator [Flavobacterium ajazii]|uniref:TetR/AcrR family transcriptional regulator n=1 Tax=Flavobacterium ajazii TaxID=2692318 RepID=UPI0013D5E670|nr:TetR/AcrR family transcriptional regulator [Flavobacterium ajazii]